MKPKKHEYKALTELYDFQRVGVAKIEQFGGRALLADEMGLGKCRQSLQFLFDAQAFPSVIVCPASLKENWKREVYMHFGKRAEIIDGTTVTDPLIVGNRRSRIFIVNYDILTYWRRELRRIEPALVILDECHYVKNEEAQRTQAALSLCRKAEYVIAISGTPMTNRPTELYPILQMVLGKENIESPREFRDRYSKIVFNKYKGMTYTTVRRLPELHKRLTESCMIRRLKKDVLKDLPEKTRQVIPVSLSNENMREYRFMQESFLEWLKEKFPGKSRKASAVSLTKMGYLKRRVAEMKLPYIFEYVDNFLENSDGKMVVFGIHKVILHALRDRYKGSKRRPLSVYVDGTVRSTDRQYAVDAFQNNDNVRLFIGQMKAAGVGLTLTAASDLLFAEVGFVPPEHTQAEDRIHRIGQRDGAHCVYMVAKDTIEEYVCEMLQKKQSIFLDVMDGDNNDDTLDLHDAIVKQMRLSNFQKGNRR